MEAGKDRFVFIFRMVAFWIALLVTACSSATPKQASIPADIQSFQMTENATLVLPQVQPPAYSQSSQSYPYPEPTIFPTQVIHPYPLPGQNPLLPIFTPSPTFLPERIEIQFEDLGLLWRECELSRSYYQSQEECLGVTMTKLNEGDESPFGESFSQPKGLLPGWRLSIGNDIFETVHQPSQEGGFTDANNQAEFRLFKNDRLLISKIIPMPAHNPNASLLNINGKYAWELTPTIIYDGVDLRQEFSLKAAYRPYVIGKQMIFVAMNNGKMFVVADGEQIDPTFDQIYNGYCCETVHIIRTPGQYWFRGTREGREFAVVITAIK